MKGLDTGASLQERHIGVADATQVEQAKTVLLVISC